MKLLAIDSYVDFNCVGADCPISCCGGDWGIFIDDESMDYYMSVEGDFGNLLRNGITKMNNKNAFKLNKVSRACIFLNESKLCNIYRELGPDALCETCKTYPRGMFRVGDTDFCYLTNSCPEVNRIIMKRKTPLKILFDDSDNTNEEIENVDWIRFNHAIRAFTAGMHLIQDKDIQLRDRLILLLLFVERFQENINTDREPMDIINVFSMPEIYRNLINGFVFEENTYLLKIRAFMIVFRSMMSVSYDHPMWEKCSVLANNLVDKGINDHERLIKAFAAAENGDYKNMLEQIMVYRFFVIFMQGYDETDYYERLAYEYVIYASLVSYIALSHYEQTDGCSSEEIIMFYSLCSRIEHTDRQKKELTDKIKQAGFFESEKLIRLV